MERLPFNEVLKIKEDYDHLEEGDKIRINHDSPDCDGGSDSMIVEKKDDGSLSIYCFRCRRSGYFSNGPTLKSAKARASSRATPRGDSTSDKPLVFSGESEVDKWHPEARAWIRRAGITDEEVSKYGLVYDDSIGRVIIPWRDGDGNVAHYQTRRIHDDDTAPKYISYWRERLPVVLGLGVGSNTMVFVEDFLSGVKIARQSPVTVLLGVNLAHNVLDLLVKMGYNDFLVWLDDDNLQVKKAQLQIKQTLDKIGKCLIYHAKGVDPKEMTDTEIGTVLTNWKRGTLT